MSPFPSENPPCRYSSSPTHTRIFGTPRGRPQILRSAGSCQVFQMDKKRNSKQHTIEFHFQRSIKMKHSGEVVKCMPSEIKEMEKFCCQYLTCGQSFTNQGALATHIKFKHPFYQSNLSQKGTLSKFVQLKSRLPISQSCLPLSMVS